MKKYVIIIVCLISIISIVLLSQNLQKTHLIKVQLENNISDDISILYSYIDNLDDIRKNDIMSAIYVCNSLDKELITYGDFFNECNYLQDLVFAYKTMLQAIYNERDYTQYDFAEIYSSLYEYISVFINDEQNFTNRLSYFNNMVSNDKNKFGSICIKAHQLNNITS